MTLNMLGCGDCAIELVGVESYVAVEIHLLAMQQSGVVAVG